MDHNLAVRDPTLPAVLAASDTPGWTAALLTEIRRNRRRYEALCYRFQQSRLRCEVLLLTLRRKRDRHKFPIPRIEVPEVPLYVLTGTAAGRPRLVRRSRISGGADFQSLPSCVLICRQRPVDGGICLSLSGEVDIGNVATLQAHLRAAAETAVNVVVEMAELRYIDSSGIRALVDAQRRYAWSGQRIVLAAASPLMRQVLKILGVDTALRVFPTVEAAVEGLRRAEVLEGLVSDREPFRLPGGSGTIPAN